MFRRLIMTIFRLYTKYLLSSYTKHTWAVYMGRGRGKKWARDLVFVRKVGRCALYEGSMLFREHNGDNEPHDSFNVMNFITL